MGEEEYDMYKNFSANIQKDVSRLKGILATIESRSTERGWLKQQSYGEIDDARLVDGITGEKYIYKRRGSIEESPFPQQKRIRFVMDVSGSMYRFNGCKFFGRHECYYGQYRSVASRDSMYFLTSLSSLFFASTNEWA